MRVQMDHLTLDTNVVRDHWEQRERRASVSALLELAARDAIDLAVTRYIRDDVPNDPLASRIDELPLLGVTETGGVLQFGVSRFGGPDGFGDQRIEDLREELAVHRRRGGRAVRVRGCGRDEDDAASGCGEGASVDHRPGG